MSDETSKEDGETALETATSWLEQFEATSKLSLASLEKVVLAGLQPIENEALIVFAAELIKLAEVHEPEALAKVEALLH